MATRKTDPNTGNTFGEEFAAQRRAGAKKFMWNGTEYNTNVLSSPNRKGKVGTAPVANPRDDEIGMSRGTNTLSGGYKEDYGNEGRGAAAKLADENFSNEGRGYKRGGRVTGYKGYGKARKV